MKKQLRRIKFWLKVIAFLILANLAFFATCVGIYGQVGDCPAQYMCIGGNFTAVVDVTDELNGTNQGCLSANEGTTSYWVRICALTAGTIQFTISPSGNNNDYDWAVYNGSNCPPTAAPIRCSFAISAAGPGGDNTGVNSINNAPQTDNSEGVFGNQWTQDINTAAGNCYIISINNYGPGSNNFGLTFGGTAILDCGPLPISLLIFEGFYENNVVLLDWSTTSETNNSHFIIEKIENDFGIKEIGRVEGSGNSNTVKQYNFIDLHPSKGINYYRLIQYDINGNSETYNWISILVPEDNDKCCKEYFDLLGKPVNFETVPSGIYLGLTENNNIIKLRK
jgi:hypothetical protein